HTVDGVAEKVVDEQGEAESDRHRESDDNSLAPPQGVGQEQDHDGNSYQERFHQIIYLLIGGLSVIPRDTQMNSLGQHLAGEAFGFLSYFFRDPDCIGALPLGHRHGHRRVVLEWLDPGRQNRMSAYLGWIDGGVGFSAESNGRIGLRFGWT